ncbi:hypothetical protein IDM40_03965 [Nocardiopsis sp. HNM0947]|uniref:Uncharacterized protein n=1 Tax=Nocardiopsis coralli TaxID=2772213 RepID=A0ABR9P218_9ACTN|nr:hypothetical protein [Nocardiopsis coralli]MBE2997869.1 hypothetical protein [Nocardiopsis coralli]
MSKGAKIALVGGAGVLVLVLVAGTVVALSLGQGSDETVASAADDEDRDEDDAQGDDDAGGENDGAPSAPSDGESEVFEGSGDELVELDPPHADPQILTVEGNGDGMVSVTVVSEDGDEVGHASSLRGEEGGTRTIYNHRGYDHEITGLDVRTSNDSWTLTIEPLDSLDPWTDPDEPLEGSGRDVVLIDWDTSGVELEMEHDGTSNFIVWGGNPDDGVTDLLANEIGEVDMGEQLSDGTTLLEIDADGDWTLTPA